MLDLCILCTELGKTALICWLNESLLMEVLLYSQRFVETHSKYCLAILRGQHHCLSGMCFRIYVRIRKEMKTGTPANICTQAHAEALNITNH